MNRLLSLTCAVGVFCFGGAIAAHADSAQTGPDYRVNNLTDLDDGACTTDNCSLREAIAAANDDGAGGSINFEPTLNGVIVLTDDLQHISQTVSINALGGGRITIDGHGAHRILSVVNDGANLTLRGLTLRNGHAFNDGSALYVQGDNTATVLNCSFVNNVAPNYAGAIYRQNGRLNVVNSTFDGNSAGGTLTGGAVGIYGGTGSFTHCTFRNNIAWRRVTFAGSAGAILIYSNPVSLKATVQDCIFAGNRFAGVPVAVRAGGAAVITSLGFNTSGDNDGAVLTGPHDQPNLDPLMAGANNNGGDVLTCALQPGSPALNSGIGVRDTYDVDDDGDTSEALPLDTRGPGFARLFGVKPDRGAFEMSLAIAPGLPGVRPRLGIQ